MAVWYDVLINLGSYFRAHAALSGVAVKVGAFNPNNMLKETAAGGVICLVRDHEGREKLYKGGEGVIDIMAFCHSRSDNPDPAVGYKKISDLEDGLVAAVTDWMHNVKPIDVGADITYVEIDETMGDLDCQRPLISSRKIIRIEWSKRTL